MENSFVNPAQVRLVAFLAIAAFMVGEPLYHYKYSLGGFRDWKMFQGAGWGVIDARFTRLRDDGGEVPIDRLKLLESTFKDQPPMKRAQNNVWLIHEKRGGELRIAKQLCAVLPVNTKIKIYSRISKPTGWQMRFNGQIFDCVNAKI